MDLAADSDKDTPKPEKPNFQELKADPVEMATEK
jgi:hypothetical protein